jgi:hypothetical protein
MYSFIYYFSNFSVITPIIVNKIIIIIIPV